MAEAGVSFRQILASLSTAPAERYGESTEILTGDYLVPTFGAVPLGTALN
jgi:hypothetical protein